MAEENYQKYHFADIVDHWACGRILWVYNSGLMVGTSTYLFSPNSVTTRAMVVNVLYKMAGTPSSSLSTFSDVPSTAYYAKAVGWASKNGIVSGVGNNKFEPNGAVKRQDLVVMLYNYAKYAGKNTTATGNINNFSDASSVSSYAKTAMNWAIGKKIISGSNGYLKPIDSASRAEFATMLYPFKYNT